MKVVSIGGIANDETSYFMWLEAPFTQPSLKLEKTQREGRDMVITRARRESLTMNLSIIVYGASEAATKILREALLAALDTGETAIALVVSDDDGNADRYRYVVVQSVDEQKNEEGPGQLLVATLVTHGESRWRAIGAVEQTWALTASEQTVVVPNGGSLPARPVYTIKPTAAKNAPGNAFGYRAFCAVRWEGRSASFYPVDITGANWDTDALITAGKITAQTNIAVQIDGAMRKRWLNDYDTADTSVWVNLDWIYCPNTYLLTGFGSGDTVTTIDADGAIDNFPFSGILQIDSELFTYTGKDNATRQFTGVTRAARESTAAAHTGGTDSSGDTVHLIQHDIWLLYGDSGYWLNTYDRSGPDEHGFRNDTIYKPMFDLTRSSNDAWWFDQFGQDGAAYVNRAMSWRRGGAPNGTFVNGDPWDDIILTNGASTDIQTGESFWAIQTAYNLYAARIVGRAGNFEPGTPWQVGLYSGGAVYVNIAETAANQGELRDFDLTVTGERYGEDVRFYQRCGGSMQAHLDICRLFWAEYPTTTIYDEVVVYDLNMVLENVTTGKSITLALAMAVDEQLEVDTENHTVTLLDDGSSQYQALTKDSRRREMLELQPGNNTLKVTEDGLDGMTVYIEFEERSYS